jgi:hypothetical protein
MGSITSEASEAMPQRLFISYARADGESLAIDLYKELTQAGYFVWWDKQAMENRGRTFIQEVKDAIEQVDRLLLVVTPGAAESVYVRDEWEYALSLCKVITPLLRLGFATGTGGNHSCTVANRTKGTGFEGLTTIWCALPTSNPIRTTLLVEMQQVALTLENIKDRGWAFHDVAAALAAVGQFAKAGQVARDIQDNQARDTTLSSTAAALAQVGQFVEAEQIARSIENQFAKADALQKAAFHYTQAGKVAEAERIALSIQTRIGCCTCPS